MLKLHWLVQSLWYQQDCSSKLSMWAIVAFVSKSSEAKYTERAERSLLLGLFISMPGKALSCFPSFFLHGHSLRLDYSKKPWFAPTLHHSFCRALNVPCTKRCGSAKNSKGSGWKIFSITARQWEAPCRHFAAAEVLCRAQLAKCSERVYTGKWGRSSVAPNQQNLPASRSTAIRRCSQHGSLGLRICCWPQENLRGCLLPVARYNQKNGHHLTEAIPSQHPRN